MTRDQKAHGITRFIQRLQHIVDTADVNNDCRSACWRLKWSEKELIKFLKDADFPEEAASVESNCTAVNADYGAPAIYRLKDDVKFDCDLLKALLEHLTDSVYAPISFESDGSNPLIEVGEDSAWEGAMERPEITESLARFRSDHPERQKTCFIMMRFDETPAHKAIVSALKQGFRLYGIEAIRADEKDYHEDLFPNVLTYLHGCGLGVAVYERIEQENFNPNISLEVGYLLAMKKPLLILKDKTLNTIQTDLVGKLYKPFDPQGAETTIPRQIAKWLKDRGIVR